MIAGVKYLMSQDGSYSKQTTTSDGKTAYQAVPAPQGATIATLPATRVLVTVAGTTYYLSANAFYRRVMNGAQESFVVVTAPAGVVFVAALPANFEVVQLNTMYFRPAAGTTCRTSRLTARRCTSWWTRPPTPPPAPAQRRHRPLRPRRPTPAAPPAAKAPASAPATPAPPAAAPVRAVVEHLEAPAGTVLVVRLATEVSSATAQVGNRFQGFLDQDLAANGRMIAPHGAKVYGVVSAVDAGSKMKGHPTLSVTLTDMQVGGRVRVDQDAAGQCVGRDRERRQEDRGRCGARRHHRCHCRRRRRRSDWRGGGRRCRRSGGRGQLRQASRHRGADPAGVHAGRAAAGGDHDERGRPLRQETNMKTKHSRLMWLARALALIVAAPVDAQDLQQKLAAAKQAAALNQQALR